MRVHCTNCGRDGHAKWQCTRPTKSTAVRKADVRRLSTGERDREPDCVVTPAGSSVLPVDTDTAVAGLPAPKGGSGSSPVDTEVRNLAAVPNNPSSPKGSGVESLRTPTEGRKGRDSTSGGARAKLRDPSAVLTQTAAQPPVGTNSTSAKNEVVTFSASHAAVSPTSAGTVGNKDRQPFNKTAYQREYMARYRAEIKSGKRVPKRKGETT